MSRSIKLLLLLLVLQAGFAVWVNLPVDNPGAFESEKPLLSVEMDSVDAVTIEQTTGAPLRIARKDKRWVLPGKNDFPVAQEKFEEFAEKLVGARRFWPVGKTMVAARQFKVTEEQFERRVRFLRGEDVLGDVFLGSSPGFRKVHARLEGDPLTYAIDFNAFDAPAEADRWYDTEVLKARSEDIARIDLEAYALKAAEGGFQVEGLRENEETDVEPVRELVERVTDVDFKDVLFKDGKARFDDGQAVVEYVIEMKDGTEIRNTVVAPAEGDHYILKSSAQPHYFEVDPERFDKLRDTSRVRLVKGAVSG